MIEAASSHRDVFCWPSVTGSGRPSWLTSAGIRSISITASCTCAGPRPARRRRILSPAVSCGPCAGYLARALVRSIIFWKPSIEIGALRSDMNRCVDGPVSRCQIHHLACRLRYCVRDPRSGPAFHFSRVSVMILVESIAP